MRTIALTSLFTVLLGAQLATAQPAEAKSPERTTQATKSQLLTAAVAKFQDAMNTAIAQLEDYLNDEYASLTEDEQDDVVNTRLSNIKKILDAAQSGTKKAQNSIKYMGYGTDEVKTDVTEELSDIYIELRVYEEQVLAIDKKFDKDKITNDEANDQLNAIISDAIIYLDAHADDYATILSKVLKNQVGAGIDTVSENVTQFEKDIQKYKDAGLKTKNIEKTLTKAQEKLSLAQTQYSAGENEANVQTKIRYYNQAGFYTLEAHAAVLVGQRALMNM